MLASLVFVIVFSQTENECNFGTGVRAVQLFLRLPIDVSVYVCVYVFLSIHADTQATQGRLCWVSVDPIFTFAKHCNYLPSALYREGTQITWIFVSQVGINESRVPGISLE